VLLRDPLVVDLFPLPHSLDELFASQIVPGEAFLSEFTLHHCLSGDASMICARHPQRGLARHAVVADERVLHGSNDSVAKMERASDVGRWHGDDKGFLGRVDARLEIAARPPPVIQWALDGLRLVSRGHLPR